jgi:hypothetical protein
VFEHGLLRCSLVCAFPAFSCCLVSCSFVCCVYYVPAVLFGEARHKLSSSMVHDICPTLHAFDAPRLDLAFAQRPRHLQSVGSQGRLTLAHMQRLQCVVLPNTCKCKTDHSAEKPHTGNTPRGQGSW